MARSNVDQAIINRSLIAATHEMGTKLIRSAHRRIPRALARIAPRKPHPRRHDFEIDGVPVAYGEYTIYGNLSGMWASGDTFYIGEVSSNQVTLRPPTPAVARATDAARTRPGCSAARDRNHVHLPPARSLIAHCDRARRHIRADYPLRPSGSPTPGEGKRAIRTHVVPAASGGDGRLADVAVEE